MNERMMYQVSTLQALALGYSRTVIDAEELKRHGDTGLGTFENIDGEMIMIDGKCFSASEDGSVAEASDDSGIPFASVTFLSDTDSIDTGEINGIGELKTFLDLRIEEDFGLNSMHVVRVDGHFESVSARSVPGIKRPHHVELKSILDETQQEFEFEDISGSLVCVYYPDYMDGINASGWHIHFISKDRKKGGHVFDISMDEGTATISKINRIEIRLPDEPAFDTYSLKSLNKEDIGKVEQGEGR